MKNYRIIDFAVKNHLCDKELIALCYSSKINKNIDMDAFIEDFRRRQRCAEYHQNNKNMLRNIRVEMGLTQESMSELLGVTLADVCLMENGDRHKWLDGKSYMTRISQMKRLDLLSEKLGVDKSVLYPQGNK